jgi:16S rRNA (cytosine1402-N4)-methyltransferase
VRATLPQHVMSPSLEHLNPEHTPVMLKEALDQLQCKPGGIYVDATLGMAGHAQAILRAIEPGGLLIGIDRDKDSLEIARAVLKPYEARIRLFHDNFKNLPLILNNLSLGPIDGILVDLGVSSYQLLSPERGFSFQGSGMLDMRMDQLQRLTAADLVNELPQEQLANVIYKFGEERLSRKIAAAIVSEREKAQITRCSQLADIVTRVLKVRGHGHIHPATRTFQALRIAVNQELEGLDSFLAEAASYLKPGGRMVVISFHSLEDRIAKTAFKRLSGQCVCNRPAGLCICPRQSLACIITPRPMRADAAELSANPKARSARLRSIERI